MALADLAEIVRLAKLRVSRRDAIKAYSSAYADTVVLIRPERRRTLTTIGSQYRIPRIEVRRRDAVAGRKRATGIPFDGGGILDALCRYAGLRGPRRSSRTCGFRRRRRLERGARYRRRRGTDTVVLAGPERGAAVLAAAAQDGVPTVQLGGGDAVAGGKGGTDISGLCRGVFGAVGNYTRLRRPWCS